MTESATGLSGVRAPIESVRARAYTIPTDTPAESDGTLVWDSTTIVVVHIKAGGRTGLGYSYTHAAAAQMVRDTLGPLLQGRNALAIPALWQGMVGAMRNLGDSAVTMMAIAAVDNALWDLKARLLDLPLASLLGAVRNQVPIYGSGGFTSYTVAQLQEQLGGWVDAGIDRVKMKIGREAGVDPDRVQAARSAIGLDAELYVDANGGYTVRQALSMAELLVDYDVTIYEEPVHHRDLNGLRRVRDHLPRCMVLACGEYGFNIHYFKQMIESGAVDLLQADVTRCGVSGFLKTSVLCEAHFLPLASHCAPAMSLHVACAAQPFTVIEYFHDHVRIENMLFDGVARPEGGMLAPDLTRPGIGLELKERDAAPYLVS